MLDIAVAEYSRPGNPRGCMVISDPVCAQQRRRCRSAIATRLRKSVRAGEIPSTLSPRALADFIFTVLTGLSTYARDGATRQQLQAVADVARLTRSAKIAASHPSDRSGGPFICVPYHLSDHAVTSTAPSSKRATALADPSRSRRTARRCSPPRITDEHLRPAPHPPRPPLPSTLAVVRPTGRWPQADRSAGIGFKSGVVGRIL